MTRSRTRTSLCLSVLAAAGSLAATPTVLPKAGQPTKSGKPGTFEIVGTSGVSAQQMFLGAKNAVYIIDKVENNPAQVAGHPAWASEYRLSDNVMRPMDVKTNSFCAGGGALGNGTWVNLGGNQAVTWGGNTANSQTVPAAPYDNLDGGKAIRFLDTCDDSTCNWVDDPARYMPTRRWYPALEPIDDGSLLVIGGNQWGGFVNSQGQNNPTYEFLPSRGQPVGLNILTKTLPANLFPLTFMLPSGNALIQTNWGTEIFDFKKNVEYPLDDIPHAVRTYPASGGSIMLPLTPANNWTATILFCGGSDLQPEQWTQDWAIANYPADASCVKISPDVSTKWQDDDSLPEGRSMGNMIALPDGKIWMGNGANKGVAGYGNVTWAIGHSYADAPVTMPLIYDPAAPAGSRWSRAGLSASTVNRMYHSTAVLLPDGSLLVSGSNPNPDVITTGVKYPTEYRVERFYPSYYDKKRPDPDGVISQLGYGGSYFNVTLTVDDLAGDISNIKQTKAVVIRTGFSTHAMNMGQRYLELQTSYTATADSATLHVSQMPPNPSIFAPGPAYLYIVVNGVPSVGQRILVGTGQIGPQNPISAIALPPPSMPDLTSTGGGSGSGSNKGNANGAGRIGGNAGVAVLVAALSAFATMLR